MRISTSSPVNTSPSKSTVTHKKTISFARDILPLFRATDIQQMNAFGVRLGDHAWMSTPSNAQNVLNHLRGTSQPRMPLGGPYWSDEQLDIFEGWVGDGYPP